MAELQHFSHGCALTSPDIVSDNICNICYKDKPVEFACIPCNFHLCKTCTNLPQKVSHDFHSKHPLEFCLGQYDRKPGYVVCSGCGHMTSGSFYECKECEIYLDLGCALSKNIVTAWNAKEMLHYSHSHLLRRCRPGPDARGSCLLCELPLSPYAICYGCVHCYSFFHERCLDLPTEIQQHPAHPTHPLRRLDFTQTCGGGRSCNACELLIDGVPFGCIECNFDLHFRCADSLLRGLMHKSHHHSLFYVPTNASRVFGYESACQICMGTTVSSLDSYYQCVQCDLKFHFECLEIPESVVKKSCHIHPLVCKIKFLTASDSMEYCGVCETMINSGHHVYSCQECDFFFHIECILNKERRPPLCLKDLYQCGQVIPKATEQENCEPVNILAKKLMVKDFNHIHLMRPFNMNELGELSICNICGEKIRDSPWKCDSCSFRAHHFCAELGKPSRHRLHWNHPLTLLSRPPARYMLNCDICRQGIDGFNLFCRICNFIIDMKCALKGKHILGVLGQKFVITLKLGCMSKQHSTAQVTVSRSYPASCAYCDEIFYGNAVSCMECEETYHVQCFLEGKRGLFRHPLHSDHWLELSLKKGSTCIACKLSITKYGYHCSICDVNFHIECIKAVSASGKIKSHSHYLYNFWMNDSMLTPVCCVCGTPCGASFYGCIDCNFNAHVECIGFPDNVKNQKHQHMVELRFSYHEDMCSLCGSGCYRRFYFCNHCDDVFHKECIMFSDDREAAIEDEQRQDIYIMHIERDLFDLLGGTES